MLSLLLFSSVKDSKYLPSKEPCEYFCTDCNHGVHANTKHCNKCGICVDGFDHHCVWLNICIGRKNYRLFLLSVVAACLTLVYSLIVQAICFNKPVADRMINPRLSLAMQAKLRVARGLTRACRGRRRTACLGRVSASTD